MVLEASCQTRERSFTRHSYWFAFNRYSEPLAENMELLQREETPISGNNYAETLVTKLTMDRTRLRAISTYSIEKKALPYLIKPDFPHRENRAY